MGRTYKIDGQPVGVSPGWSVADKINARSTLGIQVIDLFSLPGIDEGDSIEILNSDGTTKIFSGIVSTIEKYEDTPGVIYYNVNASDNSAIADKRLIAQVFENHLAGDIVKDIISQVLSYEGILPGNISDGQIVKKAVFNYIKCSQALDYLKSVTGLNWNIDKDKKLQFFDRNTNVSPVILNDSFPHSNFRQKSSLDSYRNTQYVRGGKGKTALQVNELPSPKPDGSSRTFVTRYPLAEKPVIEINLNSAGWVAILASDIGVNGIDENKKWYFSFGSNNITQESSQTVLSAVDAIRLNYSGLRNLFVRIDDPIQISSRAAAESGTTGIYESLAVEASINDSGQAIEFAQGLIQTYGEITDRISFETEEIGIEAGQLLSVQKTLFGITDEFLIESVSIRPTGPDTINCIVSGLDGAAVGGWEEFFKKLITTSKDFVISENEVIILLQNQLETEGINSSTFITSANCIYPSESLFPSETLYPGVITSEVTMHE